MIFIDNKYTKWYYSIIQNSKKHSIDGYFELHHIVPKSFFKTVSQTGWLDGDPNHPDNLVKLTAREHFVCHLLLTKMTTGMAFKKCVYAVRRCRHGKPGTPQYVASSRVYKIIKEQWDAINPFKDPSWQKNNAKKLKGKTFTEEHKNNIKKSWTPERREALSKNTKELKIKIKQLIKVRKCLNWLDLITASMEKGTLMNIKKTREKDYKERSRRGDLKNCYVNTVIDS